jgi:uncharacterized protein (DUF1778 family)
MKTVVNIPDSAVVAIMETAAAQGMTIAQFIVASAILQACPLTERDEMLREAQEGNR